MRVAGVQSEPVWLDLAGTVDKTVALIEEASSNGAALIAFPETWIPGYPVFLMSHPAAEQGPFILKYRQNSLSTDSTEYSRIREAARKNAITVVVGFSERAGGSLYMAQSIIGADGEVLLHRRKLLPSAWENTLFGMGDGSGITVVDTPVGRVGALNCGEHIQPLTHYSMIEQGEEVHVAAWPCLGIGADYPVANYDALMAITQTYSYAGGAYVISSSQVMSDAGAAVFASKSGALPAIYTGGGGYARVYGPNSELLTEVLPPDQEGIVYAEIDPDAILRAKADLDIAGRHARDDVFTLHVNRSANPLVAPLSGARS